MDNFWNENCRLCLDTISSKNFEKISNDTKEILDILLLKLDIDKTKHVICKVCAVKVREALKFKSMCISTDNLVISYVDDETESAIDLLEIYAEKKGSKQLINTLHDRKVCRLCMQLIQGEFISVHEIKLDAIEKYIPEVNINVIEDPVVCRQCFDFVHTHSSFLRNCLEVEEKIKGCCGCSGFRSSFGDSVSELRTETAESIIKQENNENDDEWMKSKFTLKEDDEYEIKTECIDIKREEDDESATIPISSQAPLTSIYEEHAYARNSGSRWRHRLRPHQLKHKDPLQIQIYKCYECDFTTNSKWRIKKHQLIHVDLLKEEMYQCDKCSFATKYKDNLKRHQLVHNDQAYGNYLRQCRLKRKNPSQVPLYKCNTCIYENRHRHVVRRHELQHKDSSQVQMYKCEKCGYETRHRRYMTQHRLRHKDPSQAQTYECDMCFFKTDDCESFAKHQEIHTNPSREETYRCEKCSFASKYKKCFDEHQLTHENLMQEQLYKCDKCRYATRYRSCLDRHQLRHKDDSQVRIYKCDKCSFKTDDCECFPKHQQIHTNPSEEETYRCDKCNFASRYKKCLDEHQLTHEDPSQVQLCKVIHVTSDPPKLLYF